jgi:hypothetical protein
MALGTFGGSAPLTLPTGGGGGASTDELMGQALDRLTPSPQGQPALSQQLAQLLAGYGNNFLVNGSCESWSAGTSSAPDGWTLSGAGATIARNTTSGQVQEGLASCSVTAALNTVTRLSQTITVSATQNTRLRGRQVALSARVLVSTASRVSLELDDGVLVTTSALQHTGSGSFETLAVTITVDSAATQIKGSLLISSGASITAIWDAAKLEEGATATAFAPNARDAFIQPRRATAAGLTTISNATPQDLDSMSFSNVILDGSQSVLCLFSTEHKDAVNTRLVTFRIVRDSTALSLIDDYASVANQLFAVTLSAIDIKPAAGNYTYKVQWANDGISTHTCGSDRYFAIVVVPSA